MDMFSCLCYVAMAIRRNEKLCVDVGAIREYGRDSIPISQNKTNTNPIDTAVIIQHTLAIACKELQIAADASDKGKTPFQLQSPSIVAEIKIVTQHHTKPVLIPQIVAPYLTVPHVVVNIRIVIIFRTFGNSVPGIQEQREVALLKTKVAHDTVPAPGQRFRATVGLMIEAQINSSHPHPQHRKI